MFQVVKLPAIIIVGFGNLILDFIQRQCIYFGGQATGAITLQGCLLWALLLMLWNSAILGYCFSLMTTLCYYIDRLRHLIIFNVLRCELYRVSAEMFIGLVWITRIECRNCITSLAFNFDVY